MATMKPRMDELLKEVEAALEAKESSAYIYGVLTRWFIEEHLIDGVWVEWCRKKEHLWGKVEWRGTMLRADQFSSAFVLSACFKQVQGEWQKDNHTTRFEFWALQYSISLENNKIILKRTDDDYLTIHTDGEELDISQVH